MSDNMPCSVLRYFFEGLTHFLERGFAAVNYLFDSYGFPESENEMLSMGVSQIFANNQIDSDGEGYGL